MSLGERQLPIFKLKPTKKELNQLLDYVALVERLTLELEIEAKIANQHLNDHKGLARVEDRSKNSKELYRLIRSQLLAIEREATAVNDSGINRATADSLEYKAQVLLEIAAKLRSE